MALTDPKGLAPTRNAGSYFRVVESPRNKLLHRNIELVNKVCEYSQKHFSHFQTFLANIKIMEYKFLNDSPTYMKTSFPRNKSLKKKFVTA